MLRKVAVERPGEFQAMLISVDSLYLRVACRTTTLDRDGIRTLADAIRHGRDCYIVTNSEPVTLNEDGLSVGDCKAHVNTGILEGLLTIMMEGLNDRLLRSI